MVLLQPRAGVEQFQIWLDCGGRAETGNSKVDGIGGTIGQPSREDQKVILDIWAWKSGRDLSYRLAYRFIRIYRIIDFKIIRINYSKNWEGINYLCIGREWKMKSRDWPLRFINRERIHEKDPEVKKEQRLRRDSWKKSGVSELKEPSFKGVVSDVMYLREVK